MADISTPKLSSVSSHLSLRNNKKVNVTVNIERHIMPSRLTVDFIRQFARVYHVTSILPDDFNGMVLN